MLDRPAQQNRSTNGKASAPLLLLPGTLCDARLFAPVLDRLETEALTLPLGGADTAATLAQLILAAAPDRFALCGFSLGAIVALEIVAQAPHRVDRLALIGCNPFALSDAAHQARAAMSRLQFIAENSRSRSSAVRDAIVAMADDASSDTYGQQTAITLSRIDSVPRLHRIGVPTLVLCGEADEICPPGLSRTIASHIPGARLAVIDDAGHYVTLERPEDVARELTAWLAQPSLLGAPNGRP